MNINLDEIQVKIKFVEQKKLKAIITLDFGDFVIKGFRVMESEYKNESGDNLWLLPPSYKSGFGKYHPMFFMPDKEQWKELEKFLWDEYYRQSKEYNKKKFDLEDAELEF